MSRPGLAAKVAWPGLRDAYPKGRALMGEAWNGGGDAEAAKTPTLCRYGSISSCFSAVIPCQTTCAMKGCDRSDVICDGDENGCLKGPPQCYCCGNQVPEGPHGEELTVVYPW